MLNDALARARKLVAELEEQKKQIDQSPPKDVDPDKFAEGKHAIIKAIASARRMLAALVDAERIADSSDEEDNDDNA